MSEIATDTDTGRIALACDPSFARALDENNATVFPAALLQNLSKQFEIQVLGQLDTLPFVFIKASPETVSALNTHLENAFGDKVSVERDSYILTDIPVSPSIL